MRLTVIQAEGERGKWKVRTLAYFYRLADGDDKDILVYHWNPNDLLEG